MLQAFEGMPRADHTEAGFEQRLVVGFAVVGDQHVEGREVLGEAEEQRGFLAVIAHEELAQAEAGGIDGADADQEGVGAAAAGEAGGFGVEERPAGGMGAFDGSGGKRLQQVLRKFGQIADIDAAVAAVRFPKLLGFEVLPEGGGDHFAGEQFLDVPPIGALYGTRWRGRGIRILSVDAGDTLAQGSELLLDILHSLFLCPI